MPLLEIESRKIHYEVHGEGPRALVMGGWGTFCHGGERAVPRAVLQRHETLLFDYPGIGSSTEDPSRPLTTSWIAEDVTTVMDHLGWSNVRVIGMVGLGGCVAQELAINRPDLVSSLVMTGTWAFADPLFTDQLEGFRRAHLQAGFDAFQLLVASFAFTHEYYNNNRNRLIGPNGAWKDLRDREGAHSRLIDACLSHDTRGRLERILCPALVVHAGRDPVTRPDMTQYLEAHIPMAEGFDWPELGHVVAGRDAKIKFDKILIDFLAQCP